MGRQRRGSVHRRRIPDCSCSGWLTRHQAWLSPAASWTSQTATEGRGRKCLCCITDRLLYKEVGRSTNFVNGVFGTETRTQGDSRDRQVLAYRNPAREFPFGKRFPIDRHCNT